MGIPKFFKWLTRRYPLILQNVKKEEDCPPVDNLYLDLNGIIHNNIHGNDKQRHERVSQLTDFEEVWINIMKAIDELVHTVKPKKLLFLAIDGVAPRAKMNQQRARRFRSAKDAQMLRTQLSNQGKQAPELFDSNAISPGTKFMFDLNTQLEYFLNYKLNTDPLYQNLQEVIFSGVMVPGEGEHKMMDYIRQFKIKPNYNPNTRHCFYGADADLIMLSLLTHEPHFTIIREEHIVKKIKQGGVQRIDLQRTANYQIIQISLLREYFQLEYQSLIPKLKIPFNLERIIDDFAFFCFFIGNDFLPSLTTLDISEGSLDKLIDFYKDCLPEMDDYITHEGKIYWNRAEPFIKLLGQHEHETFRKRITEIGQQKERIITFDQDFNSQLTQVDRKTQIQNKVQEKIYQKKQKKIQQLVAKHSMKKYKKFALLKRFQEEEDETPQRIKQTQIKRQQFVSKYSKVLAKYKQPEEQKEYTAVYILNTIKEEELSDLQPEDIPDDEVSDVNENDFNVEEITENQTNQEIDTKILVQTKLAEKYTNENYEFMVDFVKTYSQDSTLAKMIYYRSKVKFDIRDDSGQKELKRMLKKYLEGLQWVYYYYFKGAQHWRWFYPYHYAPLISDLGSNIVQNFLQGNITIESFEIDSNCTVESKPYTPFQQLLSILPTVSIKLLPSAYKDLVSEPNGILREYFPDEFDIDLNGRTLPWEAVCLIPFVQDDIFLLEDGKVVKKNDFRDDEIQRNVTTFDYYSMKYLPLAGEYPPLASPLTSFPALKKNYVFTKIVNDYQDVGKFVFSSSIHPKAQMPCIDFPSFKWLDVKEFIYDVKYINKVPFKRIVVKIPQAKEDDNIEELEKFINVFLKKKQTELFVDFPYQLEAYPVWFETSQFTYQIYPDQQKNGFFRVHRDYQQQNPDVFESRKKRIHYKLMDNGIDASPFNVIVTLAKVTSLGFDSYTQFFYKNYAAEEDQITIPFNLMMSKRSINHYLNVSERMNSLIKCFKRNQEVVVCFNTRLLGVIGKFDKVKNYKNGEVVIKFNKEIEEQKIHDPFIAQNCLNGKNNQNFVKKENTKRYVTDQVIQRQLKLQWGVVGRITGSLLVSYTDKDTYEKQVIDLGLNIKNMTKKVHIPDYVRFVKSDEVADYQYDQYEHNTHARGAKHVRKYFEYSEECVEVIKQYYLRFPEVFEFIEKLIQLEKQRKGKALNDLRDIFPQAEHEWAVKQVKLISGWIESLELSKLPYVEMGFNALATDLISKIGNQQQMVRDNFQNITLQCKEEETLNYTEIFQEFFPFWTSPFSQNTPQDYQVGDRIMNINSTIREYVPFGFRGTVIGKTNERVLVLFDEPFLHGSDQFGHCEKYKGASLNPNHLFNLTRQFEIIMKKDIQKVLLFQEQPQLMNALSNIKQTIDENLLKPHHSYSVDSIDRFQALQDEKKQLTQATQLLQDLLHVPFTNTPIEEQFQDLEEEKEEFENQEEQFEEIKEENEQEQEQEQTTNNNLNLNAADFVPIRKNIASHTQFTPLQSNNPLNIEQTEQFPQMHSEMSSFIPPLQQNSDYQALRQLIDIAKQMEAPLPSSANMFAQNNNMFVNILNKPKDDKEDQVKNLNVEAAEFKPSWLKK